MVPVIWASFFLRRGSRLPVSSPTVRESKTWKLYRVTNSLHNATPRTELPSESSRGDHTHTPMTPGTTSIRPPETPLLAGRPMVNANSPEWSYIPHDDINDRQWRTVLGVKTGSLVR